MPITYGKQNKYNNPCPMIIRYLSKIMNFLFNYLRSFKPSNTKQLNLSPISKDLYYITSNQKLYHLTIIIYSKIHQTKYNYFWGKIP